jgi:hypothetical protein
MTHTMIPRTNYLMEQESFPMQAQAGSDGSWYCLTGQSWLRRRRWALQGHAQVAPALGTPCLGPCGPRDMIS